MVFHKHHSQKTYVQDPNWYKTEMAAENIITNRISAPKSHKIKILFELEKLK